MELVLRPNFTLSQAISGHGAFNAHLCRIGKRNSPLCRCGCAEQTPGHVFRECQLYGDNCPSDWRDRERERVSAESIRQYLIATMNKLWLEEKEEERTGATRTGGSRRRRGTTGADLSREAYKNEGAEVEQIAHINELNIITA